MKRNILVVDDDADVLKCIKDIFEHEGDAVITTDNGMDCLKVLEKGFTGILLIDIVMPYMDGWATIKEIVHRGLEKNISIVVITAIGSTKRHKKMKGLEPYILDYIAKPFEVQEMIHAIEKLN
jgi:DNA-binding response OmpR family regulator